jgi:hypothetical protein
MKNPNHFHQSPLVGGATRNRTWLAFHRGLVSAAAGHFLGGATVGGVSFWGAGGRGGGVGGALCGGWGGLKGARGATIPP